MSENKKNTEYAFDTEALHAGFRSDFCTGSRGVPVYRTAAYYFDSAEHASDLFSLSRQGNIYSRIMNPTNDVLERRMSVLEGGKAALAVSSGTAAVFYSIITICKAGDEIIAMNNLYGGTHTMFEHILPQFGIRTRFVPYNDPSAITGLINDSTKLIYAETIGNPSLGVADLKGISSVAKKYHVPFIVDSTFSTPALLRPIEFGADIVVHSMTKWLGGHGVAIGGIVVDSGSFDWDNPRFPLFVEPDQSYHGIRFCEVRDVENSTPFISRMRLVPLRNMGACMSPDSSWMILQGIETLSLRMGRHCENAMQIASFLESHPSVSWVMYPGLESHPDYPVAQKQFLNGFGGMVVFGVKGGYKQAVKLIDSIDLFSHMANVGDVRSLILHPASTSHRQLSRESQEDALIKPEMIRISAGIEEGRDLIAALENALNISAE